MASQFLPLAKRLGQYFIAYGGFPAVFGSPFFLGSVVITGISYSQWLDPDWVPLSQSLIPSLLGFSLGTYAILFGLITTRMKRALRKAKNSEGISYLDEINATFFHFVLVQVLSLLWAVLYAGSALADVAKALTSVASWIPAVFVVMAGIGSFIGMLLLVYSILLVLSSALAVYRLARIVDPQE